MAYKDLMYEWIRSDTKHPIFSVEEMLSLSDFSDWLDELAAQQSVQRTVDQPCEKHNMEFCSECFPVVLVDFNRR